MRRETGRGRDRYKTRDLLADERCSQVILDSSPPRTWRGWSQPRLRKTHKARRRSGNSGSGGKEMRRVDAEELGAGGEEQPLFLPRPSFMASAEEE
jgi:hypothetical protein